MPFAVGERVRFVRHPPHYYYGMVIAIRGKSSTPYKVQWEDGAQFGFYSFAELERAEAKREETPAGVSPHQEDAALRGTAPEKRALAKEEVERWGQEAATWRKHEPQASEQQMASVAHRAAWNAVPELVQTTRLYEQRIEALVSENTMLRKQRDDAWQKGEARAATLNDLLFLAQTIGAYGQAGLTLSSGFQHLFNNEEGMPALYRAFPALNDLRSRLFENYTETLRLLEEMSAIRKEAAAHAHAQEGQQQ